MTLKTEFLDFCTTRNYVRVDHSNWPKYLVLSTVGSILTASTSDLVRDHIFAWVASHLQTVTVILEDQTIRSKGRTGSFEELFPEHSSEFDLGGWAVVFTKTGNWNVEEMPRGIWNNNIEIGKFLSSLGGGVAISSYPDNIEWMVVWQD